MKFHISPPTPEPPTVTDYSTSTTATAKKPVIRVEAPRTPSRLSARQWRRHAAEVKQMNDQLGRIVGLCLSDMMQIEDMAADMRWWHPLAWVRLRRAIIAKAAAYKQQEI